jgi:hypothetical protein
MSQRIPVGEPESEKLELKSKEALADPQIIAREVVAMLNSLQPRRNGAGEIWIGVRQSPNSVEVQAIDDAETERQRLQDHLLDKIEPRPVASEVAVRTVPADEQGGPVILVEVGAPEASRRPFALLHPRGGRHYLRRFGDRTVPMSREEIFAAAGKVQGERRDSHAVLCLRDDLNRIMQQGSARLWLGLEPETEGEIDFEQVDETGLLIDPTRSGTPRSSFNFTVAGLYQAPRIERGPNGHVSMRLGNDSLSLRLRKTGALRLSVAVQNLAAGRVPFVEEGSLLSPEPLLGYLVSTVRLASALLQPDQRIWRRPAGGQQWALLAVLGLEGWGLLPGNLANWPSRRYEIRRYPLRDLISGSPLGFPLDEVVRDPERCAMRLVELLYEAFGFFRASELPGLAAAGLVPET